MNIVWQREAGFHLQLDNDLRYFRLRMATIFNGI